MHCVDVCIALDDIMTMHCIGLHNVHCSVLCIVQCFALCNVLHRAMYCIALAWWQRQTEGASEGRLVQGGRRTPTGFVVASIGIVGISRSIIIISSSSIFTSGFTSGLVKLTGCIPTDYDFTLWSYI